MLKLVRNCDDAVTPKTITAASAKVSPTSQRTAERSRSRTSLPRAGLVSRDTAASGSKMRPPLPQRSSQVQRDPSVESDRRQQQRPRDRLVPEGRDAEHVERREDGVQEERSEGCA